MARIKLEVEPREGVGKNKVNKLRRLDIIPGVVYGNNEETRSIQVTTRDFDKVYREAGETTLIDLTLGEETGVVLIKDVQKHPFKNEYLHIDFQQLSMDETVKVTVPIVLVGEENVDKEPATVMQQLDEIEVECLPLDIPQTLEIDVSDIDFDTPKFISDLSIFADDKFVVAREAEDVVASLVLPDEEPSDDELEEAADLEAADVPVVGEEEEEE